MRYLLIWWYPRYRWRICGPWYLFIVPLIFIADSTPLSFVGGSITGLIAIIEWYLVFIQFRHEQRKNQRKRETKKRKQNREAYIASDQ